MLHERLFPQFRTARWGMININDIAIDLNRLLDPLLQLCPGKNLFLNPEVCENWKNFIHKIKGIDYSWGGYMEDRSTIWKDHYQEPDAVWHVGVDYYVPVNTQVMMPMDARLMDVLYDKDQNGGWGGRLIFQTRRCFFILAHLKDMVGDIGRTYFQGEGVGVIAEAEKNGNWSPHLHVQCMKEFDKDVDGYMRKYEGIEEDFPDPTVTLW